MTVTTIHPKYAENLAIWQRNTDAVQGESAIKSRREVYLPMIEDKDDYEDYLNRAYFIGIPGATVAAFVGMVFRKSYNLEMPDNLIPIQENFDGSGQSIDQVAKEVVKNVLTTGRHVLFADFPDVKTYIDYETQTSMGAFPFVKSYSCFDVTNWREDIINGKKVLSLLVLREQINTGMNEFSHDYDYIYRVLRLKNGVCTVETRDDTDGILEPERELRQADGSPFPFIPAVIVGSENNRPSVDSAPISDICSVAIAQYHNIADLEETAHTLAQICLHIDIGETSSETWKEWQPDGVKYGSKQGIQTVGGKVELLQAQENQLLSQMIDKKTEQMQQLGARIMRSVAKNQTAEAARLEASAEGSILDTVVNNVSEGIEFMLECCGMYIGEDPEEIVFSLNKEFWEGTLDAQSIMSGIALKDNGIITKNILRDSIRAGKIMIPDGVTNDDIDDEAETADIVGEV